MKKLTLTLIVIILSISKTNASIITSSASDFFLDLAAQVDPTQSATNEWQIGMYNGSVFELFEYSASTVLGRSAIVGWVKDSFHAGFLNTSSSDEVFPGNVFGAGTLNLHPGQSGADIVLRYLVQQGSEYNISGHFFAIDTIESPGRNSDGVNVSVRVNGNQLNDDRNITGFGAITTHQVTGSDITLQQGDIIDFIVKPRDNYFDDATVVTASVSRGASTSVSEPATIALMLFFTSILWVRRRSNR